MKEKAKVKLSLSTLRRHTRSMLNYMIRPLYARKEPLYPLNRRLGVSQNWSGQFWRREYIYACWDLNPGLSSPERELYQLCYPSSLPYSNYNKKQMLKYKICKLNMLPVGHDSKYLCYVSDILTRDFHVFLHL
jgi:hypothetical protein